MNPLRISLCVLMTGIGVWGAPCAVAVESDDEKIAFFENRIRPLLLEHCASCHGPQEQESELRLDTYEGIMRGGASATAVLVPGKPEESLLLAAVSYLNDELQMPPERKLSDGQIEDLRIWIERGAVHPDAASTRVPAQRGIDLEEARRFWAFQPPRKVKLPAVQTSGWPQSPLDYFILAELEAAELMPAPPADKRKWLRRVSFDLTGLPPTPAEVESFLADESPDARGRVVDRLLQSPRYGERWARHWLDIARYADSNGLDENVAHGNAWRYRDYVIAALNKDKSYDRFLAEQLAGDLLDASDESQRHEHLVATGFLTLGPKVLAEGDEQKMEMDIIDEQLSTLSQSVLGLTVGCARCHDHKFDPISQEDYYALAGIFKSTRTMESFQRIARWNENEIATAAERSELERQAKRLAEAKQELEALLASARQELAGSLSEGEAVPADFEPALPMETKEAIAGIRERITVLEKGMPSLASAMGAAEGEPTDLRVHLRGNHLTQGKQVPRGVPVVLAFDGPLQVADQRSGRLALARWLVRPDHPLTARVFVNRVWRWYFGQGLVASVDNFGTLGERPENLPLLDWLAVELIESGWSLKHLHRCIVLSSTYQMSSRFDPAAAAVDPQNRTQWRANLRRLEAEEFRDALLSVSGMLDTRMGGSLLHVQNREFIFNHTSQDETSYDWHRRSIYLPIVRNHLFDVFSLFDYSDASVANGDRPTSTIAPQALFLMNSELVAQAAERLAALVCDAADYEQEALDRLYVRLFTRPPTPEEVRRARDYLAAFRRRLDLEQQAPAVEEAWVALSHVLLASNEFIYLH